MSNSLERNDPMEVSEFAAELSRSAGELADALETRGRDPAIDNKPRAVTAKSAPAVEEAAPPGAARDFNLVMRIPVPIEIVLGRCTMQVSELSRLGLGAVIQLDRRVGEPVDVIANGRLVAKGEIVITDEATGRFGLSITEVVR